MKLLILAVLFVGAIAAPQGYKIQSPQSLFVSGHSDSGEDSQGFRGDFGDDSDELSGHQEGFNRYSPQKCSGGLVLHVDGTCVEPIVSRNIYLYAAPKVHYNQPPPPKIPKPRINYNVVFVRTPEGPANREPIVIPPAQEQTLVYVLSKNKELDRQIIEIPESAPRAPEVYYVNYNEGENPQLPGGLDLQSALASAQSAEGLAVGDFGRSHDDSLEDFESSKGALGGFNAGSQGAFNAGSQGAFNAGSQGAFQPRSRGSFDDKFDDSVELGGTTYQQPTNQYGSS